MYMCIYMCICGKYAVHMRYVYIHIYMYICAVIPHTALLSHSKLPQGKFLHRDSPSFISLYMKSLHTVKVYNQEKTSLEQIQRVHHKVQTSPDYTLPKKNLKKPDHFWKSILWTAGIKINLYQNDGGKKR